MKNNLPPHINQNDKVILFDGVCKLCNVWSNFIIRFDKNHTFKLASVQSKEGAEILAHFNYPIDTFETMLVIHNNQSYEKTDAFFFVIKHLGLPWKLLLIFKIIPKPIRNWIYDRIALNRYKIFGKYDYCTLPTPDHNKRFLDGK
ncbi:MAG: thiol-disulfide oxidoreductase DCC family protein [Saccharospirillaceae bacterium]|nr:thiol-disulfide oxidoreductase DCC family protein [Pseudomonadales bacterium]NRB78037.1 thiol-disulfide oxidoreductase DCC family protein [Saccharospirillaceae bacterium]